MLFLEIQEMKPLKKLAKLYVDEVLRLHGVLLTIVSDRDMRFLYKSWKAILDELGMKIHLSTKYHPYTDGKSEQTIQTVKDMLKCVYDRFLGQVR